jgi:hypothetical protein
VTDHDDPAEAMVSVTAGTGTTRRGGPGAAFARAGARAAGRLAMLSDADRLDAPTADLPAPRRADASTPGVAGDASDRRVVGDDRPRSTAGDARGAAARPLPTFDNSIGENLSSSVTAPTLSRTVTKSPPSVLGSPTRKTVPIVPVGNCGPDTRTRGRRPASTSSRSWRTCSSASPVPCRAAIPHLSAGLPRGSSPPRDRRHARTSRPCDIDGTGPRRRHPHRQLSDSRAVGILAATPRSAGGSR